MAADAGETILVVDDDDNFAALIRMILEQVGFRVLVAGNGLEAVELARGCEDEIHLVLLDLCMPVMDGRCALPLLREARPGMKVIIFSGCVTNDELDDLLDSGADGFLMKTSGNRSLAGELRKFLDE